MTRQEIIEKKRRMLRGGRKLEAKWVAAGRPKGYPWVFRESVDGSGLRRRRVTRHRRPFGRTAIEARAIFDQSYRHNGRATATSPLAAFKESYKRLRRG
jgi:hypothetical protein